ncbi:NUDIX hydrolase [Nocardioides terrisoli]|uniref:NUDIX hydrolase n=1 Tax=Nocardioides terrisoli TaxID=3388267 RepID=UPI00287B9DDF|nr:NUDIX domain-containing protein [Nocardioides marmorisolisilvae]
MTRIDYYDDPDAPAANSLVPAASAVVVNGDGSILMQRRSDSGFWSIPGGKMEPGESIRDTAVRETREETGYEIELGRLVGIYCDPNHRAAYSDGEVRQEFSVCFAGKVIGGSAQTSDESLEVAFVAPSELADLDIHGPIRLRIKHFLEDRPQPFIS